MIKAPVRIGSKDEMSAAMLIMLLLTGFFNLARIRAKQSDADKLKAARSTRGYLDLQNHANPTPVSTVSSSNNRPR